MFDFWLCIRLAVQTFSPKKKSLRFPTFRRIICAVFILPFFLILITWNRIFMFLDWIFFPGFRKMKLKKSAFIVGLPRSATTHTLTLLSSDKDHFTCFKLWEIIFAPSIIQKYFWLGIIKADKKI